MIRRSACLLVAAAAMVLAVPGVASAHDAGELDLPVPLSYFVVGGATTVVLAFAALTALWVRPRLQELGPERPLTGGWVRVLRSALRVLGLLALALVIVTGLFRGADRTIGPALVYVYFWLIVPVVAVAVGNWWLGLSPWRTVTSWVAPAEIGEESRDVGIWPAAALFLAFAWVQLVYLHGTDSAVVAYLALAYTVILLAAASWQGAEAGLHRWGIMENYARLAGAISPVSWDVDEEGELRLSRRRWLAGLAAVPPEPGLVAFVVAMVGTVVYDGLSGTRWWALRAGRALNDQGFRTIGLLAVVAAIGLAYLLATWAAGRIARSDHDAVSLARSFAHILVPVALAFVFAHSLTLVLLEGQLIVRSLSDPFGRGWDLFGTADWRVTVWWVGNEVIWYVQMAIMALGHVTGLALAHDRALAQFSPERAARSLYPMVALLAGLFGGGVLVLAG